MHEQNNICSQLFAGTHVVGCQPMKRKRKNASNDNNYNITFIILVNAYGGFIIKIYYLYLIKIW